MFHSLVVREEERCKSDAQHEKNGPRIAQRMLLTKTTETHNHWQLKTMVVQAICEVAHARTKKKDSPFFLPGVTKLKALFVKANAERIIACESCSVKPT